jgi:hypothetical protein
LKCLSSGEELSDPQLLPENWGPVFGLQNFEDKLSDLSWIGPEHADTGWFYVGEEPPPPPEATPEELAWDKAKKLLQESDWAVLPDVPMTKGDRELWISYRMALREIRHQAGFPNQINWPTRPR